MGSYGSGFGRIADVRAFLDRGLMLGPWLAGLDQERLSFDSQQPLAEAAEGSPPRIGRSR